MVKSMNAAVAALKAHQTKMDVISHNIANVNTWGFKSRNANFQDSLYANTITGSSGKTTSGDLGGINTSQLGYGSTISSISSNFTTSSGQFTGNALDCMINGPAFFIVGPWQGEDGVSEGLPVDNFANGGVFLSRVGMFTVDANGYLVDGTGNYVYGFQAEEEPVEVKKITRIPVYETTTGGVTGETTNPDDANITIVNGTKKIIRWDKKEESYTPNPKYELQAKWDGISQDKKMLTPIRIPIAMEQNANGSYDYNKDGDLYQITSYSISKDGTIVGVDKDNVPHVIGQIAVASVENPNGLEQQSGYLYSVGNNAGLVEAGVTNATTGTIDGNYLEMANVDLAAEISYLITTQRGYQANTKIITVTDEMLEQLVNMKR